MPEERIAALEEARIDVDHVGVQPPWGHDSFLFKLPEYNEALVEALTAPAPARVPDLARSRAVVRPSHGVRTSSVRRRAAQHAALRAAEEHRSRGAA